MRGALKESLHSTQGNLRDAELELCSLKQEREELLLERERKIMDTELVQEVTKTQERLMHDCATLKKILTGISLRVSPNPLNLCIYRSARAESAEGRCPEKASRNAPEVDTAARKLTKLQRNTTANGCRYQEERRRTLQGNTKPTQAKSFQLRHHSFTDHAARNSNGNNQAKGRNS